VDRLFLDANVLFSAAYREGAGLTRLWGLAEVALVTSAYAALEARRNLAEPEQLGRLARLLEEVEVLEQVPTGDLRHFGAFFGESLHGVLVVTPSRYLQGRG